jgi:hypothetical protein
MKGWKSMSTKYFGLVSTASLMLLATSTSALAQGVGNIGSLPIVISQNPNPPMGWDILGPVPVVLDPNGPVWSKVFTDPSGGAPTGTAGTIYPVHEQLVVSGTLPWTDWHEEITSIGWQWQPGASQILANGIPVGGFSAVYTPAGTSFGGSVDFFFNSLAPGTVVDIFKTLEFAGQVGTFNTGTIGIHEYPTPEPSTIGLLALGGLALLRRRAAVA